MDALSGSLPLALKIMLGTVAFVTGFVAIGGETYTPGAGPFLRRLTIRGRVAISCALLTFLLGASDQLVSEAESEKKKKELDTANRRITELLEVQISEVSKIKEEAILAKKEVEGVREVLGGAARDITTLDGRLGKLGELIGESGRLLADLNRSLRSPAQKEDIQALKDRLSQPMTISSEQLKPVADALGDLKSELGDQGAIRSDLKQIKASSPDTTALTAALGAIQTDVGALKADVGPMRAELPKIRAAIDGLTSRAAVSIEGDACQQYFAAVVARMASGDDAQKASFQRILSANQRLWGEASAVAELKVWVSAACTGALAALPPT